MSSAKVFARDPRGYVFMSDDRDISVSYAERQKVWAWCCANKIAVEYQGTLGGTDVWRVRDEQHRSWFALKWL